VLENLPSDDFGRRHIGLRPADEAQMLDMLGYDSAADLLNRAVPESIRSTQPLAIDEGLSEAEALAELRALADQNQVFRSLIGMGWNDSITPAVIRRNLLESPAWYTAYTPYQPEISQGRLELLLTFQTMVADLTGTEMANASVLDEATAAAEAMTMLRRMSRTKRSGFFVDEGCHPQTIAVVTTRAEPLGIQLKVGDPLTDLNAEECFGVLLSHVSTSGEIRDFAPVADACHEVKTLVAATTDLLACCLLTPPGEWGADVVVGSAQRFGVPLGFGGPNAGFMATSTRNARALPGRLVGVSVDSNGDVAYRLALQTREQHIRREKATSNICTAQALLAMIAAAYAAWHGPDGLIEIANSVHTRTARVAQLLAKVDPSVSTNTTFFDTLTVSVPAKAGAVSESARSRGINLRLIDDDHVGLSLDETSDDELVADVVEAFTEAFGLSDSASGSVTLGRSASGEAIPSFAQRTSTFCEHENFHAFHSEHEMLRWLRRLSDRDLALDRTMIPLGSCTMKLNAAAELEPVSWPEFASIHPYAPADQTVGYRAMITELEDLLVEITGYDQVSLQPNAGSQGEYAGLLAIAKWQANRGEGHRDICLIPQSAHGTNAASAVLAGMKVVVVACDDHGNIAIDDLRSKIETHGDNLAALMVTYPSTHGVYEETMVEVAGMVHDTGGQVYTDGANLNALVGAAKPGKFGSDVSHLNLHKTFAIPHGGGGPGVGPVAVAEHLAPYLPGHPVVPDPRFGTEGAVSSAPWGSAGVLCVSWMYIKMMGASGLRRATETAVLSANYVAHRLSSDYPVLYTGADGLVAHECIIDLQGIASESGISNDDVAKRLTDYGFHAPTMSFPVAGTLMIEPTESENLSELDRFCDAMISIKSEIDAVISGDVSAEDSVLRHAPHTAAVLISDKWDRSYGREQAAFPAPGSTTDKYFPPVGRIDNAYGDRNLACSCPPLTAYESQ